ncbi:nucleotidyltransferase [Priestia megaterium]
MYDISGKFSIFYKKHVVLQKSVKTNLFNKKNLNISRLKEGLLEYNEEKGTNYKIVESLVQGSVAMSTVTQNESNDYDIDVAIIFDKDEIPEGTTAVKNIVVNALKKKCKNFNVEPEAKTNCVRIVYKEGYHIDFAIYRRRKDENDAYHYEHCGSQWRPRDPRAITKWFLEQNKERDYNLRETVRLLKMFSKSRSWWTMPGGLIQSVLANEKYQSYPRIDERFYYTLKAIKNRLFFDKEVYNPVDETQTLKLVSKDSVKMQNLYNRLDTELTKLDVLFEEDCTQSKALEAWNGFFNHNYWENQIEKSASTEVFSSRMFENEEELYDYNETEEFIEYKFPINLKYSLQIDCRVTQDGWRPNLLSAIIRRSERLMPNKSLDFFIESNVPAPYEIYWKVKNKGQIAKKRNCVRGQILRTNSVTHKEITSFRGEHFVECYIVKNGVCVAKGKIDVPIRTI